MADSVMIEKLEEFRLKKAQFELGGGPDKIEKQHQIFGAINELQIVLETLDYYRNKEIIGQKQDNNFSPENKEKKGIFSNINNKKEESDQAVNTSVFLNIKDKLFKNFKKE